MMEVKQNTAVDLNDLLTSSKNSGSDEVDAVMTDLSDRTPHGLENCNIKTDEKSGNIEEVENGDAALASLIKDVDDDVGGDLNISVNSELEDALLAEDDVLPELPNNESIEPTLSAADDILADKTETSNSTTSSSNVRDPGDDLDTLLSKINDIVEDCIENDNENTVCPSIKIDQSLHKDEENQLDDKLNQSAISVDKQKVAEVSNCIEVEKSESAINNIHKNSEMIEETENPFDKETSVTPDLDFPFVTPVLSNHLEEENQNKIDKKSTNDENDVTLPETEDNYDKVANQSNSVDNITENKINIEKTEESKKEMVQDNKITSNSNEIVEDDKKVQPAIIDNDATTTNKKVGIETTKTLSTTEETDTTFEKETKENNEKDLKQDVFSSENAENDDSDDEIVFYVDKPPETEKTKESKENSSDPGIYTTKTESTIAKIETPSPAKETVPDDDDVVLLLDDDDEEVKKEEIKDNNSIKYPEKENNTSSISTDDTEQINQKDIITDNSDNARDDFAIENANEKEKSVKKTEITETPEETNSNCSSSSNLLQEARPVKTAADEPTPEEAENDEEEDDGDVELIISELKEPEVLEKVDDSEIAPPAKRIRLSEDGEQVLKKQESCDGSDELESANNIEKKPESKENPEQENKCLTTISTLKRSHEVIELEVDEKSNDSNEGNNKKPKTEVVSPKKVDYIDDKNSEDIKIVNDDKNSIKAVPSYEPIRLYPAPNLEVLKSDLSLEYLKKFRKSFDKMTKQDLEELVLQKVVEAIIHKSEFSEMRELFEKQEKLISAHRTKISELSKQFRDLEMVHNRVVKDIEQRNSQFIMPVKITRAVGLQVYIPNKKSLSETASGILAQNIPTSPQRPVPLQASSTPSTSLTPPQRQFLSSQTDQQRSVTTASNVPGNASSIRRGCVQKITPIRPVPGGSQSSSAGPSAAASTPYRNTPNHVASAAQPRILNKNATTNQNSAAVQRSRYLGPNQDGGARMPTQQISRTANMPANSQRVVTNATTQSKPTSTVATTTVQRRSEPLPSQTSSNTTSSIVDNYLNTLTHLTGSNTAVSITPAKPKEKAVIDLTDEDEAPVQSPSAQPVTQIPVTQVQRRSLPNQNNSNSSIQHGRTAPTMARVPPASQMANSKNRQLSSVQAQKNNSFTSISTPPGTSITRISVAPNTTNVQRVKYSHPAPLPATPPQAFNPSWKLPPPRPTIRISNLDNGIVISWTMEESMERHAECVSYQIYAYQETSGPPMVDSWRHVGDVKAMLLPMAVTLTQFQEGQRYYFAVRAVDCHQRYGPFSLPKTWS